MALDIGLIITSCVFAILVILGAVYFIVYFQHPQDRNLAWFPKIVVITSLALACFNIFLLPLQAANSTGVSGSSGLPMEKLTIGFYGSSVCMILIMIPFTVFFYEGEDSDDDKDGGVDKRSSAAQVGYALRYIIPTMMVFGLIVFLMYWPTIGNLGTASIRTTYLQSPIYDTTQLESTSLDPFFTFTFYCNSSQPAAITLNPKIPALAGSNTNSTFTAKYYGSTNAIDYGCSGITSGGYSAICCSTPVVNSVLVSPVVFIVAVLTLIGWVVFSVFCGVGMASLPYDWLNEFKHRPRPITASQYQSRKKQVGEQASILMDEYKILYEELKIASRSNNFGRKYQAIKRRENSFRKNVLILEYHYKNLEDSYRFQGGDLILQYSKFYFACLSVILTLLWIIHDILYTIPATLISQGVGTLNIIDPFLNNMLKLTAGIPIVGIVLYSLFVFYLLACVLKGNAKLGMNLVIITIHPLIYGETLMSAMVFNAGVILLCSLPLCQYAQTAFGQYASTTANQSIFGVQIASLSSISWGFDFFIYVMLGMCVLTFLYQIYNPFKKQAENQLNFKWQD